MHRPDFAPLDNTDILVWKKKKQTNKIFRLIMKLFFIKKFPYIGPLLSLFNASLDITWPHVNFIGGLSSELCCLNIGQANIE